MMLTLFPFEADFYRKHQVPVHFVGHPLADQFSLEPDINQATQALSSLLSKELPADVLDKKTGTRLIACLPGSREGEVRLIGPTLWAAVKRLYDIDPNIKVIVPAQNPLRRVQIEEQLRHLADLPIYIVDGHSQAAMAVADCVVMASGTTTLEAMLLKKPMVVVYKKAALSYAIISRLLKVPYVSLPNLLANEALVPELLQNQATPDTIANAVQNWFENPSLVESLKQKFAKIHPQLQMGASSRAANAIVKLLDAGD